MKSFRILMSVIYGVLLLLTIPALIKLTSSPQEPVSSVRNNKNLIVTEQRVFDDADILSDSEEKALEKKAKELAKKRSLDIVLVTVNDENVNSPVDYTRNFYYTHDFGYEDSKGTGVLYMIDMYNRVPVASTFGKANQSMGNARDRILEASHDDLASGDYYDAFDVMLDETDKTLNPASALGKILIVLPVSLVGAGIILLILLFKPNINTDVNANTYLDADQYDLVAEKDNYINTIRTSRTISAGGSTGSSGRSGGGGSSSFGSSVGRKF